MTPVQPPPAKSPRGGGAGLGDGDFGGDDGRGGGGGGGDDGGEPPRRGPMDPPPDASTLGIKIFLVSLTMLFGATLLGYVITRVRAERWEDFAIPGLNASLAVSTVLIVLVSASLHFGERSIRYDHRERLRGSLVLALILAVLFLVNQVDTWRDLFAELQSQHKSVAVGEPVGGDLSVFLFYAMTVLHALHVVGGFVPLLWTIRNAFANLYSGASFRGVHNCALYWHFIDAVWILIAIALATG